MMNEGGIAPNAYAFNPSSGTSACGVQNCSRYICASSFAKASEDRSRMNSFVEPALRSPSSFHH